MECVTHSNLLQELELHWLTQYSEQATGQITEERGFEFRQSKRFFLLHSFQTNNEHHPASYTMGMEWEGWGRGVNRRAMNVTSAETCEEFEMVFHAFVTQCLFKQKNKFKSH